MNIYGGGKILNTYNRIKYRPIQDDEIKPLFEQIKLNPDMDFPLPEKLIQHFINDGSIDPTLKNCSNFTDQDFDNIIIIIRKRKNVKKLPPKPSSKKKLKKNLQKRNKTKRNFKGKIKTKKF
jgi:hypothetical protein